MSDVHDMNVITEAGRITVSKQLLGTPTLDMAKILHDVMFPSAETKAEWAELRAKQEAEWDEKTALGLVGLSEAGCYDCGSLGWDVADRPDHVDRWVYADAWQRYVDASQALEWAEMGLDPS